MVSSCSIAKTHTDQSILRAILLYPKRNYSQTFKSSSCQKSFLQSGCYYYNLLRRMLIIPCDNWKALFLYINLQLIWGFFHTAQKMKFSIKDSFSKCDQICRKLWIWLHLLKKSLMENLIFCGVSTAMLLRSLKKVFWKSFIFYGISAIIVNTNVIYQYQSFKIALAYCAYQILLTSLILFALFNFVTVHVLFYEWNFLKKIKTLLKARFLSQNQFFIVTFMFLE